MILSEDTPGIQTRDENVFLTLIELNQKFGTQNRPFKIIAEILEPKNQESIEQLNIQNIIVSSRIISFFATKLILDAKSDQFYEDVFTHSLKGAQSQFYIWVDEVKHLLAGEENLAFRSYAELVNGVYYNSDRKLIPLGMIRDGKITYFCRELDKKRTLTLRDSDSIIYVRHK